jgi:hypothetical protein
MSVAGVEGQVLHEYFESKIGQIDPNHLSTLLGIYGVRTETVIEKSYSTKRP